MARNTFWFLLLTLALVVNVWAQETEKATSPGRSLKVNVNYQKGFNTENFTFGNLAPVLMLANKRQNIHEIEINNLSIRRMEEYSFTGVQAVRNNFELAFRYQYDWRILKRDQGIDPYLGFSLLSGFNRRKIEPHTSSIYESLRLDFSNTLSLVPGIRYNLPRSFFLDFNIPIDFLTLLTQHQWVRNPNLPVRQQRYWLPADLRPYPEIFQRLHIRLGAGVRF